MTTDGNVVRYLVPFKNDGINVDTSSLEFEQGGISSSGQEVSINTRIRNVGYIPISEGLRYVKIIPNGETTLKSDIFTFDSNYQKLSEKGWKDSGETVDIGTGVSYIRIMVCKSDNSTITPSDLTSISITEYATNAPNGLYDIINNQIYTKNDGNEFTVGNVVERTVYNEYEIIPVGLLSRIMVAGGGGGSSQIRDTGYSDFTGYGGGINGGYPSLKNNLSNLNAYPDQSSGYSFGIGQNASDKNLNNSYSTDGGYGIGGAGGGWYGGYSPQVPNQSETYSSGNGGGGSGYILTDSSYTPPNYMINIPPRDDIEFSNTLMTAGSAESSCIIICEPVVTYSSGDRIICECIGVGTSFPLYSGQYKIKCAGGCGSHRTRQSLAALGGYAEGILNNINTETAYAYVGGSGLYAASYQSAAYVQATHPTLSFNGGGSPSSLGDARAGGESGGGGTDLRIGSDSLLARLIVAGGAGGSGSASDYGGAGGGEEGVASSTGSGTNYGAGTQMSAGSGDREDISGGFGYGGNGYYRSSGYGGAGGGGWYGGSGTYPDSSNDNDKGGSGGSGYVLTDTSFKPDGYLLDSNYYLTETALVTGESDRLFELPLTGIIIEVIQASTLKILTHDEEGYKYYDEENETWVYLNDTITVEDFEEYGVNNITNDTGLGLEYEVYVLDTYDTSNVMNFRVLPPRQSVKFRYKTEFMLSKFTLDSDVDSEAVDFNVTATRTGIAENAYVNFDMEYNIHDVPSIPTRIYSVQGFTQGNVNSSTPKPGPKPQEPRPLSLLRVGTSKRIPYRFKNYIGSFINTNEAIETINSAVVCEHNRCIYSATLCNNSIVRFAKLNLVSNTSTIIKDIPKNQLGDAYIGDIKVTDDFIYITAYNSNNSNRIKLYKTPNSSDPTVISYMGTDDYKYYINAYGKMEWLNNKTLAIMMRYGLACFDIITNTFTYMMSTNNIQQTSRRDMVVGDKYILSLYDGNSNSAYVVDIENNTWVDMYNEYGITWEGSYPNSGCYKNGKFYVVQRNRLHILDEETMTIEKSVPTPFTDINPKRIVCGDNVLYITTVNTPTLYIYDLTTETFRSLGLPFSIDNMTPNGWIGMCAFKGYCFIPQIKLFTTNYVGNAKYNMGFKYNQFVAVMNKTNSEVVDSQYEYDDRFVTFTDDDLTIHEGVLEFPMLEIDVENHIKKVLVNKNQYNKILGISYSKIEPSDDEEENTEESEGDNGD
ncbi:MAG: hypothetical protein IKU29_00245 [Parabacteroides sp.]|nr:hypothetical protein [Parabacteroides sp.]